MRKVVADIPEARFGIFAFERLAFPLTQLTFDHAYLDAVIEGGIYDGLIFDRTATDLGNAFSIITKKKQNMPDLYQNVNYVVLLSDGNLTESYKAQIDEPLLELAQAGVTVIPVGIGNTDTTGIPIKEEGKCVDKFIVKDDEYKSISLQTDTLQHIATTTKGSYFGEADIFELVNYLRNNALKDVFVNAATTQRQKNDISWIFILIATIAMMGYMILDINVDLQIKKYFKKILHRS
jgi:hypothetical protein